MEIRDLAGVAEHLRALEIDVLEGDLDRYGRDETMDLAIRITNASSAEV